MAIPVMADTVPSDVTVGNSADPPYMYALTMTPDHTVGDGVQVNPEFAIPNDSGDLFPPTLPGEDGWRMVCFYLEIGHQSINQIQNIIIDVNYPASFNAEDAVLFGSRANALKFEINAMKVGDSSWAAEITYPWLEEYPDGTDAEMPPVSVRQLVYGQPSNWVDVNASGSQDAGDMPWQEFLPFWGTDRVQYAIINQAQAIDNFVMNPPQAIVVEICAWMWYHQPGVHYTVKAKAATGTSAPSSWLTGEPNKFLNYNRVYGCYLDFDSIIYANTLAGGAGWNMFGGDRYLDTLGTTIWNNGNVGAQVLVDSTKMVIIQTNDPNEVWDPSDNNPPITSSIYYNTASKTIDTFDAELYFLDKDGGTVQYGLLDPYYASDPALVIRDANQNPVYLQACRPTKIQFSVHPEVGQEAGLYRGYLTISCAAYTGTQLPTPNNPPVPDPT